MRRPKKEKQIIGLEIDFTCPYCQKKDTWFWLEC